MRDKNLQQRVEVVLCHLDERPTKAMSAVVRELVENLERAEAILPSTDCARDELVAWAVERGLDPDDVGWLLGWAQRRLAQFMGIVREQMTEIQEMPRNGCTIADAAHAATLTLARLWITR